MAQAARARTWASFARIARSPKVGEAAASGRTSASSNDLDTVEAFAHRSAAAAVPAFPSSVPFTTRAGAEESRSSQTVAPSGRIVAVPTLRLAWTLLSFDPGVEDRRPRNE